NEKTSFNLQVSYDEAKEFGLAANVAYDIVPGFTITAEVDWANATKYGASWTGIPAGKTNAVGGILRFQRSF
ncbi:porin, partial [Mesorhizobium sp. 65-26]